MKKIINLTLVNGIKQYIKMIIHHYQVGFISGMQGLFNIHKSINLIQYINKLKNKNPMIISIDAEYLLVKFNIHLFKKLQTNGYRGDLPQHNKDHI